jgi:hypothetical protein
MGKSIVGPEYQRSYLTGQNERGIWEGQIYAYGFKTALHGCLQVTGSYCRRGVSGFSFKGVYRAPIGTTSREASYIVVSLSTRGF